MSKTKLHIIQYFFQNFYLGMRVHFLLKLTLMKTASVRGQDENNNFYNLEVSQLTLITVQ